MDSIKRALLEKIADPHEVPEGAYKIRANGKADGRKTTANIDIVSKTDKQGIDVIIKENTKNVLNFVARCKKDIQMRKMYYLI